MRFTIITLFDLKRPCKWPFWNQHLIWSFIILIFPSNLIWAINWYHTWYVYISQYFFYILIIRWKGAWLNVLINKNAQGCQSGTRLILNKYPLNYQIQQKNCICTLLHTYGEVLLDYIQTCLYRAVYITFSRARMYAFNLIYSLYCKNKLLHSSWVDGWWIDIENIRGKYYDGMIWATLQNIRYSCWREKLKLERKSSNLCVSQHQDDSNHSGWL